MPDEKFDEKDREKREEKSAEEKSWEEKYRRDPVNSVVWALILVWAGLVLLADNLGLLDWMKGIFSANPLIPGAPFIGHIETWSIIFIGAGVILLLGVLFRLIIPDLRRPVGGSIFLGLLFIGIGLGNIFGWNIIWPLILIALGISFLLRGWMRPRE